jgi:hypothetical protein
VEPKRRKPTDGLSVSMSRTPCPHRILYSDRPDRRNRIFCWEDDSDVSVPSTSSNHLL